MIAKINRHIILALLTGAAGVFAGCSSDRDILPEEVKMPGAKEDLVTLSLNVSIGGNRQMTRAGEDGEEETTDPNDPNGGYVDQSGDFEKVSELRVIIMHELEWEKLSDKDSIPVSGTVEANRLVVTHDNGMPIYDDLEFEVIAKENKRIYLVANEHYLTASTTDYASATAYLDSFKLETIGENGNKEAPRYEFDKLAKWTVSLPNLTATTEEVTDGLFMPRNNRRLPQTEFFDIYVDRYMETEDVSYANLFLTRAAAKANFYLDTSELFKVGEGEEIVNSKITAIKISGIGTEEYVFPKDALYNPDKYDLISTQIAPGKTKEAYISNFALPEGAKTVTYVLNGLNRVITDPKTEGRPEDFNDLTIDDLSKFTRINTGLPIYFPESILEEGKHYEVSVQINNNEWLSAPLTTNILNIDGKDAIARDTYLPIVIKFLGAADISVEVLPWDREDYYVDYTANVGITDEGCLKIEGVAGQTGDFLALDKDNGQLLLNYGKVATGKFFIASPLNTRWDAYLVTTGGTQDAIQFQIPNPDYVSDTATPDEPKTITTTHISGEVGKDEANFGIVSTVAPGPERNSAQLLVFVTLVNGTQVIANVIRDWDCYTNKKIDRLTVIENAQ